MKTATFFLSAVTDEFGSYREAVRAALDRPGIRVEIQETFLPKGDRTLVMLDEYVGQCDALIQLAGHRTGAAHNDGIASPANVDALLLLHPDLPTRIGVDETFLRGLSYTQWEAWLALYHGKRLFIAPAKAEAPQDNPVPDSVVDQRQRNLQATHLAALQRQGHCPSEKLAFANVDKLVIGLLRALQDMLPPVSLPISPRLPPSIGSLFKGRDDKLKAIRVLFRNPRPRGGLQCPMVAVWGMGGLGKTRLAAEYAHTFAHENSALLLVSAGTEEELLNNLADLTGVLRLSVAGEPSREVRIMATLEWLKDPAHRHWFLIVDSVDDEVAFAAVEAKLRELHHGQVILTGRLRTWPDYVTPLSLDMLSLEHSTEYLLEYTDGYRVPETSGRDADRAIAEKLAQQLDGLALALTQAAFAIKKRALRFSDYLTEWGAHRDELLDDPTFDPRRTGYPYTVAVTWRTSYDQVMAAHPLSGRLFDAACWLAAEPIPERLVRQPWSTEALACLPESLREHLPRRREDLLIPLYEFCLADGPTTSARTFHLHRLVQDVGRRWQRREGRAENGARLAAALVLEDFVRPEIIENLTLHVLPELRQTAPHALAVMELENGLKPSPIERSRVFRVFSEVRWTEGRLTEALECAKVAVAEGRKIGEGSVGSLVLAQALRALAFEYQWQYNFAAGVKGAFEAIQLLETLVKMEPDNLAHQRELSIAMDSIGQIWEMEGDYVPALVVFECVHGIGEMILKQKPNNPIYQRDLAIALENLGRIREKQGENGPALAAFERSLEIGEILLQQAPGNLALQRELSIALENVGRIREKQNEYGPALECYERSQRICEILEKEESGNLAHLRDQALTLNNVGRVRVAQAEYALALAALERSQGFAEVLVEEEPGNPSRHRDLAIILSSLGQLRESQGEFAQALMAFERSQAIFETLVSSQPGNFAWHRELYILTYWCGRMLLQLGPDRRADSQRHLERARDLARNLVSIGWAGSETAGDLAMIERELNLLG